MDQYRDDDNTTNLKSNIPSLDSRHGESPPYASYLESVAATGFGFDDALVDDVNNHHSKSISSNIAENKALLDDMYDELAMLEDMVANKNPPLFSPTRVLPVKTQQTSFEHDLVNEEAPLSPNKATTTVVPADITPSSEQVPIPKASKTTQRQTSRESSLGLPSNSSMLLCRTPSTSSSHSQESISIDLSGLDDLLAEVDGHRGGGGGGGQIREKYGSVLQVINYLCFVLSVFCLLLVFLGDFPNF